MRSIFGGFALVFLFGSLSRYTPNTPWSDITVFFRKNKKEYLNFSNKFRGNFCLVLGLIFLLLFLSSFIFDYGDSKYNVFTTFIFVLVLLITFDVITEIKWRNTRNHQ